MFLDFFNAKEVTRNTGSSYKFKCQPTTSGNNKTAKKNCKNTGHIVFFGDVETCESNRHMDDVKGIHSLVEIGQRRAGLVE